MKDKEREGEKEGRRGEKEKKRVERKEGRREREKEAGEKEGRREGRKERRTQQKQQKQQSFYNKLTSLIYWINTDVINPINYVLYLLLKGMYIVLYKVFHDESGTLLASV